MQKVVTRWTKTREKLKPGETYGVAEHKAWKK